MRDKLHINLSHTELHRQNPEEVNRPEEQKKNHPRKAFLGPAVDAGHGVRLLDWWGCQGGEVGQEGKGGRDFLTLLTFLTG